MDASQSNQMASHPVDIILFCDTDASLFKAIVRHYSPEVDGQIAHELGYLNFHHRARTRIGLSVNYFQFEFLHSANGRLYRITRFDSLEDASKFLLSEPCQERGAVIVCSSTQGGHYYDNPCSPELGMIIRAKALVRKTLGFGCAALLFDDARIPGACETESEGGEWISHLMDFAENGILEKSLVKKIDGVSGTMLDSLRGCQPKQKACWPAERLHSLLNFFHTKLAEHDETNEDYLRVGSSDHEHQSQILTARFYCFDVKEGGSPIAATDNLRISIAGRTLTEGHIVDSPGLAIEPGKLCQDNVLIWLRKAVAVESRDQFVVRRMDGTSVGLGVIVSCN